MGLEYGPIRLLRLQPSAQTSKCFAVHVHEPINLLEADRLGWILIGPIDCQLVFGISL